MNFKYKQHWALNNPSVEVTVEDLQTCQCLIKYSRTFHTDRKPQIRTEATTILSKGRWHKITTSGKLQSYRRVYSGAYCNACITQYCIPITSINTGSSIVVVTFLFGTELRSHPIREFQLMQFFNIRLIIFIRHILRSHFTSQHCVNSTQKKIAILQQCKIYSVP